MKCISLKISTGHIQHSYNNIHESISKSNMYVHTYIRLINFLTDQIAFVERKNQNK